MNAVAKGSHVAAQMKRKRAEKPSAIATPAPAAKEEATKTLQIRLDMEFNRRYDEACAKVKLNRSVLGEIAVEAVVALIERDGRITVPLEIPPAASGPKTDEGTLRL